MATRFVRVDLSDEARDYRPLAIEPGVPMLDKSTRTPRSFFAGSAELAAEPVWDGDSVNFYVCDNRGGRLEEVICQPASEHELHSLLRDELALLKDRLEKARAETPTERVFRKSLLRTFHDLLNTPGRTDLDSYFFRYRDLENRWRLVWCWGYQRIEQEPAPAVVCTDPNCALLFVRRPGKSPKCPSLLLDAPGSAGPQGQETARPAAGAACCSCWRPGCWDGTSVPIAWWRSPIRWPDRWAAAST